PRQHMLHLVGIEATRPEHPQPTGLGNGGYDVAAVAEGEDRELDPQPVADLGAHPGRPPTSWSRAQATQSNAWSAGYLRRVVRRWLARVLFPQRFWSGLAGG